MKMKYKNFPKKYNSCLTTEYTKRHILTGKTIQSIRHRGAGSMRVANILSLLHKYDETLVEHTCIELGKFEGYSCFKFASGHIKIGCQIYSKEQVDYVKKLLKIKNK